MNHRRLLLPGGTGGGSGPVDGSPWFSSPERRPGSSPSQLSPLNCCLAPESSTWSLQPSYIPLRIWLAFTRPPHPGQAARQVWVIPRPFWRCWPPWWAVSGGSTGLAAGRSWHPILFGSLRRPAEVAPAALSLWLASSAPPAEVAARAGHSVRVLLTIYAHGIPGCDQIASQQIEQALRPSVWPPAGPQEAARTPGIPSDMRPCHSWMQRDTAGPDLSAQIWLDVCDLRKCRTRRPAPWITASDSRSRALRFPKRLTRPDLAHHWPTATGNGLPNRSRTRIRPGIREHRHQV
jgi:hypothetical protein